MSYFSDWSASGAVHSSHVLCCGDLHGAGKTHTVGLLQPTHIVKSSSNDIIELIAEYFRINYNINIKDE